MLKLCITFDYELFLGENLAPEEQILFQPTLALAEMLSIQGIHSTFFADVCSVFQYLKYGLTDYPEQFANQLRTLYSMGHDIQLHLHPNWLHSTFEQGKWQISATGYKLHDFGLEQNEDGVLIIEKGKRYLEETIREVDKDYRCVAYRAGGFCIQPEKTLLMRLRENGILIDSSVAQYQRAKDTIQDYDFRDMPEQLSWWMQPETGVKRAISRQSGALLEISIGGVRNSLSKYRGIPFNELKIKNRTGVGSGIRIPQAKTSPIRLKLRNLKRHLWSYGILSLDTRGYKVLMRDIDELYHKYHCEQRDQYVCLICHPKLASEAVIDNMRRFVQQVQMHPDMYEFVTMQKIASVYQL